MVDQLLICGSGGKDLGHETTDGVLDLLVDVIASGRATRGIIAAQRVHSISRSRGMLPSLGSLATVLYLAFPNIPCRTARVHD